MKVCPQCAFANPERFPACIVCNTLLVDVKSTPASDPNDPEHERRALGEARRRAGHQQVCTFALVYAVFIVATAAFPGFISSPRVLGLYLLSSIILIGAVLWQIVGQLSAPILQGALSVLLVIYYGLEQPFIFFMLAAHILSPAVLWHGIDMIESDR